MALFKKHKKEEKKENKIGLVIKNVSSLGSFSERKWDSYTKKEKHSIFWLCLILIVVFVGCCFYLHYAHQIHAYFKNLAQETVSHPVENWMLQHVPALFDTIVTIIAFICVFYLLKCLKSIIRFKSQKAKTLVNLGFSVLTYILFIIGLIIILTGWGADTVTMIASAGIITLIVGLGAQSLVEDFIAGVVIAIEGDIQVGDIVIYDDFIGTVREIGSRVTKIENLNNYINIVRNSEINQIVNTTKEHSYNELLYNISKSYSSDQIDELFVNNLERIKNSSKDIEDVKYLGLISFSDSTATYCLAFITNNKRFLQNKVIINKEVFKILKENNIG